VDSTLLGHSASHSEWLFLRTAAIPTVSVSLLGAEKADITSRAAAGLDELALCLGLLPHQIRDLDQLLYKKPHPSLKPREIPGVSEETTRMGGPVTHASGIFQRLF